MIKIAIFIALVGIALCSGTKYGQGKPQQMGQNRQSSKYSVPPQKYEAGKEQTYGHKGYEVVKEYREEPEPTLDQIKEILPWEEYEIIPDVIDEPPKEIAQVNYQTSGVYLIYGNVLTPFQTKREPSVYWKADKHAYYTIIMIDADRPTRDAHLREEALHWMVVNIPGNRISHGDVIAEYIGPIPEKKTGLHRVIVLVFKQNGKQQFKDLPLINRTTLQGRLNFNTRNFVEKYYLGDLVAGNFFQTEWDKYVEAAKRLLNNEPSKQGKYPIANKEESQY